LLAAPKALDFFVDLPFERSALQMGAIPPEVVAAGASGAILGCLAALVVQQLRHSNISLGFGMISAVLSLLYNVVSGFAPNSGIDVGAHIGGVLGSILFH
jgi:membrane associated rhomboid family serine protease